MRSGFANRATARFGVPVQSDPYWSNVVCLLHFDGDNGSTTFTDEKGHSFSRIGSAALSVGEKKFGQSSLLLPSGSHAIFSATSSDWEMGAGNFTFEAWIRPSAAITARQEIFERWSTYGIGMQVMDTGFLRAFATNSTAGNVLVGPGAVTVTHDAWHHVAFIRDGNTLRLFLDGVSQGTATFTGSINTISEALSIGYDNNGSGGARFFNGYLDEVRITKGVARYTADFTPPPAPFPNF